MQRIAIVLVSLLSIPTAACGGQPGATAPAANLASSPAPNLAEVAAAEGAAAPLRFDFDAMEVGRGPVGFTPALSGRGEPGRWEVVAAPDAPSGKQAVAQLDADRTSYRFPVLVLDSVSARDVELSVAGKPISGSKDQAIGLVWRYRDPGNYYVVRANALEDNVVLYKVQDGERTDLPLVGKGRTYGVDVDVPDSTWSTLRVRARGNRFTVYLRDREIFEVEDDTFTAAGKVGLWTKADSVTWFDDFEVVVIDDAAKQAEPTPPRG